MRAEVTIRGIHTAITWWSKSVIKEKFLDWQIVTISLSFCVSKLTAKGVIFINYIAEALFSSLFRMEMAETYSGSCQIFMIQLFAKKVKGLAVHCFSKK